MTMLKPGTNSPAEPTARGRRGAESRPTRPAGRPESPEPERGHIVTTEPMAMRAVAAELWFHPRITSRLFAETVGSELGELRRVRCEAAQHSLVDLVPEFAGGEVGVEGKIDHSLTADQVRAEGRDLDHPLVVLVTDEDGVTAEVRSEQVQAFTWERLLAALPHSRRSRCPWRPGISMRRIVRRAPSRTGVRELRRFAPLVETAAQRHGLRMGRHGGWRIRAVIAYVVARRDTDVLASQGYCRRCAAGLTVGVSVGRGEAAALVPDLGRSTTPRRFAGTPG